MKLRILLSIFFLSVGINALGDSEKAVVIVPVADLIGEPFGSRTQGSPHDFYNQLPYCGAQLNPHLSCPRIHQLLFNEIVDIIDEKNDEVKVSLPNLFYITRTHDKPHHFFWTLKKNIMKISTLRTLNLDISKIPEPLSFTQKKAGSPQTITLLLPLYDPKTRHMYSAGTRFVYKERRDTMIIAYVLDSKKNLFKKIKIPETHCIIYQEKSPQERIHTFVQILKQWTQHNDGSIPYVWGGCSFTVPISSLSYKQMTTNIQGKKASYYHLDNQDFIPKTGFDCTSLVLRAAQICGIPYFFKNSFTLSQLLKPLQAHETIEEGDIIWFPGHVMVVADCHHNSLFEARHYAHGYGKVQEIPIAKVFKGIATLKDLQHAFVTKQTLYRMDAQREIRDTFKEFKILKLSSVWHEKVVV